VTQYLFPNFLDSTKEYLEAARFWNGCWEKAMLRSEAEQMWEIPWMENPTHDGNPIFTAVCKPLRRGIRIIQEPAEPNDIDVDHWIDYVGERNDPESVRELVIACQPSLTNIPRIENWLCQWIRDGEIIDEQNGQSATLSHESHVLKIQSPK
jgi:hypothetical protein